MFSSFKKKKKKRKEKKRIYRVFVFPNIDSLSHLFLHLFMKKKNRKRISIYIPTLLLLIKEMFTNYIFHPKNIFFMRCESVIIIKKKKKIKF